MTDESMVSTLIFPRADCYIGAGEWWPIVIPTTSIPIKAFHGMGQRGGLDVVAWTAAEWREDSEGIWGYVPAAMANDETDWSGMFNRVGGRMFVVDIVPVWRPHVELSQLDAGSVVT